MAGFFKGVLGLETRFDPRIENRVPRNNENYH